MAPPDTPEFERRYARWAQLQRDFGPARSFSFAWRLPELARRGHGDARFQAALALAQTLIAMGRHEEALAALPAADEATPAAWAAPLLYCRACCLAWADAEEAALICLAAAGPLWARHQDDLAARASFAFVLDRPDSEAARRHLDAARRAGDPARLAQASLLADWSEPGAVAAGELHQALAWLRRHAPAETAVAEARHAEARFRQAPAEALVWLDHALELVERFGAHGLKPRLLRGKSRSLEAAGQLGEATRFLDLAREAAQRLGAWRELRAMAP